MTETRETDAGRKSRVQQSETDECGPTTRYLSGQRVISVGCRVEFVIRRGEVSGKHLELVIETRNNGPREYTINPARVAAMSGEILSYAEEESRIKRSTFGKTFGRFLVGAVEAWSAGQATTTRTSTGQIQGYVDGRHVSARYTEITTDFSESNRRRDEMLDRADRDFQEIDSEGAVRLMQARDQYLQSHTLMPHSKVTQYITLRGDSRAAISRVVSIEIQTEEGIKRVDL